MTGADPSAPPPPAPPAVSPRAEVLTAAVLFVLALAIIQQSLAMPRFIEQSGTGLTAPGIIPGVYGTILAILAVMLGWRALRRGAWGAAEAAAAGSLRRRRAEERQRLALAAALGAAYAGGMVGRVPFWLASALFVFAFTAAFEWRQEGGKGRLRRLLEAALLGLGTGLTVTVVFERVFLLRLP